MFPYSTVDVVLVGRFPRGSGDVSNIGHQAPQKEKFSPRERGCFQFFGVNSFLS